jgi:MFS family permease
LNAFLTFVLVRKFAMSLAEASLWSALLGSLPGAIAVIAGGRLADRYCERKPALYAAIPGWCLIVAAPVYIVGITRDSAALLLVLVFAAALFQYTYLGVTYGVFQNLLHSRMRATASALLNAVYGLVGQGLGTVLVGALSDDLAPRYGRAEGLAYALAITAAIYLWAGAHYLLAARHVGPDMARMRGEGA